MICYIPFALELTTQTLVQTINNFIHCHNNLIRECGLVRQWVWCHNLKKLKVGFSRSISAAISMAMDVPHGSELYWLNNSVHNAQVTKILINQLHVYTRAACMCVQGER